jgi:hypothetical protein
MLVDADPETRQAIRLKEAKKMSPVACGRFGAQLDGFN